MAQVANLQSELQAAQERIQEKEEQVECLTQEINSKVESFCSLTFKPSHQIIRRTNDVTRIMAKMQELHDGTNGAVSTIYLSGNPGCGKTQLSRQIGEEFFTRGSGESDGLMFVATLNAETLETLAESYLSQAKQLGITEYALTKLATSEEANPKERIQQLRCFIFPRFKQFSKWLIIADNVVNLSLVYEYLPQTASEEWGHGQVLITTQDTSAIPTNVPHTYHESLSAGMQPGDAVELLELVSRISSDEQVQEVAKVLENQPLGLAAAAFYVQFVRHGSPNYGWTNYLKRLAEGGREITEELLADMNAAYSKTMTAAIKLAIESVVESNKVLRQTFLLFSLCDSELVPIQAAVNFVINRTSRQTGELIKAKILNSSLIMPLYSEDEAPGYVRVHNVVHQVLKKMSLMAATEKHECLSVAVQVFNSLIESEQNRLLENSDVCVMLRRITTHCKALYKILTSTFPPEVVWVKELTPFISPDNVVSWLCATASVFYNLSNLSNAILFSRSACDFVQYLSNTPECDTVKANVFSVHGLILSMQCQYKSSILYHEKAAKIYTASYNLEGAALSYNNLGNVYQQLGQYNDAKEYLEKALFICEESFGEEHANTASIYHSLGNGYLELGQYNKAKEYFVRSLIIILYIFGQEHADVACSYNNLGNVYQLLGQYNDAKKYLEKALIICIKIFGEEHADVALSYGNLGKVYQRLGQHNEAKEYHEKSLIIRKNIFGEEHANVASSYNNLGNVYEQLGQYNDAKECFEKALIIHKKILGEKHTDFASSRANLGNIYRQLGQYKKAKENLEKSLIIFEKIFGKEHAEVASCYNNLGIVFQELGQYNEAKKWLKKSLIICEKIFGEKHAEVASCYNNLGIVFQELGQYNEAKVYHEKALIIRKKIFGDREEHGNSAASYNNLRNVYHVLKPCSNGAECHENRREILKFCNQTRRTDSPCLGSSKLPRLGNC